DDSSYAFRAEAVPMNPGGYHNVGIQSGGDLQGCCLCQVILLVPAKAKNGSRGTRNIRVMQAGTGLRHSNRADVRFVSPPYGYKHVHANEPHSGFDIVIAFISFQRKFHWRLPVWLILHLDDLRSSA